jgi:hypothetical protein
MEHQKDSLENKCLYKLQTQQRISRGNLDYNQDCHRCDGFNRYCDNYVKLKNFRPELVRS